MTLCKLIDDILIINPSYLESLIDLHLAYSFPCIPPPHAMTPPPSSFLLAPVNPSPEVLIIYHRCTCLCFTEVNACIELVTSLTHILQPQVYSLSTSCYFLLRIEVNMK